MEEEDVKEWGRGEAWDEARKPGSPVLRRA